MVRKMILAAVFAASLTAALPAAAQAYVRIAPPPPRQEMIPGQRPGYIWSPGHWEWRHRHYYWVNGYWLRERHGYRYSPHTWVERNGQWYLERGHWQHGDRDHDGVPDRYDRAPNNPARY